eukprot:Pgem_evm1s18139
MYHSQGAAHDSVSSCISSLYKTKSLGLLTQNMHKSTMQAFLPSAFAFLAFELIQNNNYSSL